MRRSPSASSPGDNFLRDDGVFAPSPTLAALTSLYQGKGSRTSCFVSGLTERGMNWRFAGWRASCKWEHNGVVATRTLDSYMCLRESGVCVK
jgi:hypothetical protein